MFSKAKNEEARVRHENDLEHVRISSERQKLVLERANQRLELDKEVEDKLTTLRNQVVNLQADLKIEQARNKLVEAEQKAKYAEHVMKTSDDRVSELSKIYDNYAKTLTDVVKAAHQPTINNVVK